MTNAEKQGKDILAQECKTGRWAVDKTTGEVVDCSGKCKDFCLFWEIGTPCQTKKAKWLNAEYQEPKREFSEEDKAVLRALDKAQWVARDEDGAVYAYLSELKPEKKNISWKTDKLCFCLTGFTSAEFLPISWEDDEPTSRADILGEEE